jgi:hypothetical protein
MNSNPALRKEFEAEQTFLAKLKDYLEAGKEVQTNPQPSTLNPQPSTLNPQP